MSDYEAVVSNALSSSAVWSGDRLNVTACSNAVVRELVPLIEEDTRRKHRQELLDELIAKAEEIENPKTLNIDWLATNAFWVRVGMWLTSRKEAE